MKKYHQELTVCAKQGKHISLMKCHCSLQVLNEILIRYLFDKLHYYLFGDPRYFNFIYMGVHEIDPEIVRALGSEKSENQSFNDHVATTGRIRKSRVL